MMAGHTDRSGNGLQRDFAGEAVLDEPKCPFDGIHICSIRMQCRVPARDTACLIRIDDRGRIAGGPRLRPGKLAGSDRAVVRLVFYARFLRFCWMYERSTAFMRRWYTAPCFLN